MWCDCWGTLINNIAFPHDLTSRPVFATYQHRPEPDVSHLVPVPLFSWIFLMAYSKAKLKSNSDT
jgi:hypothetical protein